MPPDNPVPAVILLTVPPPPIGPHAPPEYPSNPAVVELYRTIPLTGIVGRSDVAPIGNVTLATPGKTGLLANPTVGAPATESPLVTVVWLAVPAIDVAPTAPAVVIVSRPLALTPANESTFPVKETVGFPDTPLPFAIEMPLPETAMLRATTVVPEFLTTTPVPAPSRLPEAPLRLI